MQDTDLEYERYKDFDFSGAKRITDPRILEARERKKTYDAFMSLFDEDVQKIIVQHQNNQQDRVRLNAIIRAFYTTA